MQTRFKSFTLHTEEIVCMRLAPLTLNFSLVKFIADCPFKEDFITKANDNTN